MNVAPISEKNPRSPHISFLNKRKVEQSKIIVRVATSADLKYAQTITDEMAASAQARGTGIAKRSTEYIQQKMQEGKAVIAVTEDTTCLLYTSPSPRDGLLSRMP